MVALTDNETITAQTMGGLKFSAFTSYRPPVMVISHERSGTHFLMNSIAQAYGIGTLDRNVKTQWLLRRPHRKVA